MTFHHLTYCMQAVCAAQHDPRSPKPNVTGQSIWSHKLVMPFFRPLLPIWSVLTQMLSFDTLCVITLYYLHPLSCAGSFSAAVFSALQTHLADGLSHLVGPFHSHAQWIRARFWVPKSTLEHLHSFSSKDKLMQLVMYTCPALWCSDQL